ncbi:MarR family transcriptional regulator [Nonomuraea sp. NPDC004580]|uniref:MarR family transcriptional regulator n=1 Tax=Nonomuraea sp. NPDC004580 TaxID=3154552 RepID=UPI0033B53A53
MGSAQQPEDVFREFVIAILLHNDALADRLGLQSADVAAIMLLETRGPLPVGTISEELGLPSASTTRLIDRLEKGGYARRVRGERDRRMVTVELVPEGLEVYEAVCTSTRKHLEALALRHGIERMPMMLEVFAMVGSAYRTALRDLRAD